MKGVNNTIEKDSRGHNAKLNSSGTKKEVEKQTDQGIRKAAIISYLLS